MIRETEKKMAEETYNAWPENFPETTCLVPYGELRHSADPEIKALYDRAKNHEDRKAAEELVIRLASDEGIDKIKDIAARHPQAIIIPVHAVEGKGKNAIPAVFAAFIGEIGNLEDDRSIVQSSIVSNTGQNSWHRLAFRAEFEGDVKAGRDYILVDDVVSTGGTLSELRNFIEKNGGRVVDTIAMTNGARSMNAALAVTPGHILELERKYGVDLLQQFLKEENLYGGNHKALTDAEARTLLGAASLDEARDRITAARQEGNHRTRSKIFQEPPEEKKIGPFPDSPASESLQKSSIPEKPEHIISSPPVKTVSHETKNNIKEKKMTATELFEYVKENGKYPLSDAPSGSDLTLHTAQDIIDNPPTAVDLSDKNSVLTFDQSIDLSLSPFWLTDENDPRYGPLEISAIPIKDEDDLFVFFDRVFDCDLSKVYEPSPEMAKRITEETDGLRMSESQEKAFRDLIVEKERYDARIKTERYGDEPSEGMSGRDELSADVSEETIEGRGEPKTPEEVAFLNTLHQRKTITESLENGKLSCLPGANGFADTSPAVNIANENRYHGVNLLYLKDFQQRNGFPSAEYITRDQIDRARTETGKDIFIRKDQKPVTVSFQVKDEGTGEWEQKNVLLYNTGQTTRPWDLKAWAEKHAQERQQEKQDFLKQQYGDQYQGREPRQKGPGPEVVCASTEPEKYLGQYLAAVSMGGKFKVSPEQAKEFAANLKKAVFKKEVNEQGKERTDPFKLSKICQAAGAECKEVMREIGRQQRQNHEQAPEQKQEQKVSRGRSR
jgi:hypothetical protein